MQLSYRLDYDKAFLNTLRDSFFPTKLILSKLDIVLTISSTFVDAVKMYNDYFIKTSLNALQNYFKTFFVAYNGKFKDIRQLTVSYVSEAIYQLYDLDKRLQFAPTSFNKLYDAHLFFSGMLLLFDKCTLNINAAIVYLSQAIKDETNLPAGSLPKSFYANKTYSAFCNNLYASTMHTLKDLAKIISYAQQKISLYQSSNAESFNNATIHTFSSILLNQSNEQSFDNVPGLWTLLLCNDCEDSFNWPTLNYTTWVHFKRNLSTSIADAITQCLLQYERVLTEAYNSTLQFVESAPNWALGDMVGDYYETLKEYTNVFNNICHSYEIGSISLLSAVQGINSVLQRMTDSINSIEANALTSVHNWNADVTIWEDNFLKLFQPVLRNTALFSQYLPNKQELISNVSSLPMWTASSMKLGGYYIYSVTNAGYIAVLKQLNLVLKNYTSEQAVSLLRGMTSVAYGYNIGYTQDFTDFVATQSREWRELSDKLAEFLTRYSGRFVIDESFIR